MTPPTPNQSNDHYIYISFKSGNSMKVDEKTLCQPLEQAFQEMLKNAVTDKKLKRYGHFFIQDWNDVDFILLINEKNA